MMPAASALPCLLARPAANPGRLTFTPAICRVPSSPDASIAIASLPVPGRTAPAARPTAPLPCQQADPRADNHGRAARLGSTVNPGTAAPARSAPPRSGAGPAARHHDGANLDDEQYAHDDR